MTSAPRLPDSIDETHERLLAEDYVADRRLATAVFLALRLERPLFLEGEPGTGKTELAKALARGLSAELIRLQCYEGLDVNLAAYEWNYARQMLEIRLGEAAHESREQIAASLFSERTVGAQLHPIALGDHERDLKDVDGIETQTLAVERRFRVDLGCAQLEVERLHDQLGKLARERIGVRRVRLAQS